MVLQAEEQRVECSLAIADKLTLTDQLRSAMDLTKKVGTSSEQKKSAEQARLHFRQSTVFRAQSNRTCDLVR